MEGGSSSAVDVSGEERDADVLLERDALALLDEPVALVLVVDGSPVVGETGEREGGTRSDEEGGKKKGGRRVESSTLYKRRHGSDLKHIERRRNYSSRSSASLLNLSKTRASRSVARNASPSTSFLRDSLVERSRHHPDLVERKHRVEF